MKVKLKVKVKVELKSVSCVKAKLVCALLLKYWYLTVGYDVMCLVMRGFSIR